MFNITIFGFRLGDKKKVRKPRPGVRKPGAMWIPANVNWKFHLRPPAICPTVVAMENPSTSPMLHVALRMNTPRAMSRRLVVNQEAESNCTKLPGFSWSWQDKLGAVGKASFKDGMSWCSFGMFRLMPPPPVFFFSTFYPDAGITGLYLAVAMS